MNARIVAQGSGCPLVKEDSHAGPPSRSSGGKTAFSMPQDGLTARSLLGQGRLE